jgi:arylsulfatase/uncharacterized sulfatase
MLLTGVDSHRNGVPNIPEAIPPEQAEHENYRGVLSPHVVTLATLLRDAGFHTYMSGKWHLGTTPDTLPSRRGFERTVALGDSGADNWQQKTYAPIYDEAHWFADGEPAVLPHEFYSSKYHVDKIIEFIDSNRADGRPFFAYLPFQAVHMPVQAPQEFTDHHLGRYDAGWQVLRKQRLGRAVSLGLLPDSTRAAAIPTTADWDARSPEQQRYASKVMAVYAGMLEAMDHHLGRLLANLEEVGAYENTVFVFVSDNGPESTDVLARGALESGYMRLWMRTHGYNTDYDRLGTRGSFVNIGPSWASAAASPLAYYKFFSHEGGTRVPLIVAGPGVSAHGGITHAFAWVTDLAPTLLELAGVEPPGGRYAGRPVERMTGRSLVPLLAGRSERVHSTDEAIGYELAGNAALFQGDYKIVKDRGPVGDDTWHLYDIARDPGETRDLRDTQPERFAAMRAAYDTYAEDHGVLPVPEGYDQRSQIVRNALRERAPGWGLTLLLAAAVLAGVLLL